MLKMETTDTIVCRTSPWFFRRMLLLIALTAGLSVFFLYDGLFGYPKKNHLADLHAVFDEAGKGKAPQSPEAMAGKSSEQRRELEQAIEAARSGATWAGFAAARRLPEKEPKRYTEAEIRGQFHFAIGMFVVALVIGGIAASRRNRAVRADAEAVHLPSGVRIPFEAILRIDLTRWDRGIGRIVHRSESGEERVAKIDDYIHAGSGKVLQRARERNPGIEIEGDSRWIEG